MKPIYIRGIDPDLWRRLRVAAVSRGVPMGELLNEMMHGVTFCADCGKLLLTGALPVCPRNHGEPHDTCDRWRGLPVTVREE